MGWLVTKYLITAAVVVAVSEAAKRSEKLGGAIAALPLVTPPAGLEVGYVPIAVRHELRVK